MKICLVSKMYPPVVGGSGMYAYEIANALGRRGHDVDIYTQSTDGERTVDVHENVSITSVTKARRYLVTFETLYYSLRTRLSVDFDDYDVIHGTLMPASTMALADRRTFETPIVLTSHSFALSEVFAHSAEKPADYLLKYAFHPMNVVMDNVGARTADRIIAISEQMNNQLSERYRLPEDKITTVSHGVDTDRYRPRDGSHPAVSSNKLSLLFVGRIVTRKGVDLAIRALATSEHQNIELLVAGTGRLAEKLETLARTLGVEDRVQFLGYVPDEDLPLLYASADVMLFTSNYEGFGLTFIESLAAGTPIIGTSVGGVPDLVTDGVEGFIVDRDPQAFARAIERFVENPELADEMGYHARELTEQRTWDVTAKETEVIYESII